MVKKMDESSNGSACIKLWECSKSGDKGHSTGVKAVSESLFWI